MQSAASICLLPEHQQISFLILAPSCPLPNLLWLQIRQSAGLVLKNNLSQQFVQTTEELKQDIKVCNSGSRHRVRERCC